LNRTVDWFSKILATGEGILVIRRGLAIKRAAEPSNFAGLHHHDFMRPMGCTISMESLKEEKPFCGGIKYREVALDEHRVFFVGSFTLKIDREVYHNP
jgi:hypothetical protein